MSSRTTTRVGALLALLLALATLGALPVHAEYVPNNSYAYTTDDLNLRTGPGVGYAVIMNIPPRSRVYVNWKYNSTWYNVSYGGATGYVNSTYLSPTAPVASAPSGLPVRSPWLCGFEPSEWTWYGTYHKGYDVCSRVSRAVYAPISGRVALSRYTVTVTGSGTRDTLHHLVNVSVSEGQYVSRGQYVGTYAEVGVSRGPHLHWERYFMRDGAWRLQSSRSSYGL